MEFPSGHHTHTHHHHDPEEDERRERPPPYYSQPQPPPFFGQPTPPQPPPPYYHENERAPPYYEESHVSHVHHASERPGEFDSFNDQQPPPPPPRPNYQESHVSHVSHASDHPEGFGSFNYQQPPPLPRPNYQESHVSHVSHASDHPEGFGSFNYQQPPPPPRPNYQESHVSHVSHASDHPEGFGSFNNYQQPPPRPEPAVHVSHVAHEQTETTHHHSFKPHLPSFLHHHSGSASHSLSALAGKHTFRFFCKAEPNFSLTIRDGKVVLAPSDSADVFQHWYKDEKYSTRVKDEQGFPSFALVNKATGQAMKHSIGATHPVQLRPYNPDVLDESILWTESKDIGDGYRAVRMVNNIRLNVDAFHGDKKSGGVHNGTTIVLWEWNKGDNQRWKIIPYCKFIIRQNTMK